MPSNKTRTRSPTRPSPKDRAVALKSAAPKHGKHKPATEPLGVFTPWDIAGPCPVPTRDRWLEDADTILPWLRMGFLMLTLDRKALGEHLDSLDDKTFADFTHSLGVAARNFDQLCRFVALVQLRVDAALSAMVEERGTDGPCRGSGAHVRG